MKDYNYDKDVMIEIIEQAVSKNIGNIVSFNNKHTFRIVSEEVKEKSTIQFLPHSMMQIVTHIQRFY